MHKFFWALLLAVLLAGCAELEVGPTGSDGMKRTVTTRDASGQVRTTQRPYDSGRSWKDAPEPRADDGRDPWEAERRAEASVRKAETNVNPVPSTGGDTLPPPGESLAVAPAAFPPDDGSPKRSGFFIGRVNLRLWTRLTTDFRSAGFGSTSWSKSPRLSGRAWEGGYLRQGRSFSLLVRFGSFDDELTQNSRSQNGYFVKEKVALNGGYLEGGGDLFATRWLRFDLSLGGFYYHLRTSVLTNAPTFTYEGVLGSRLVGTIGFGAALETPWSFPVRLYAGGRGYCPFNPFDDSEDVLEHFIGEGVVGAKWLF